MLDQLIENAPYLKIVRGEEFDQKVWQNTRRGLSELFVLLILSKIVI